MRTVLASAAMLLALAAPAAAQGSLQGRLESLPSEGLTRWFLCATAQGVEVGQCAPAASLLRMSIVSHSVAEIELVASGRCLGIEGTPAPGARVTSVPCGGRNWRADPEHLHLILGNLCLEAQRPASGQNVPAVLQPCQTAEGPGAPRQQWVLDPEE